MDLEALKQKLLHKPAILVLPHVIVFLVLIFAKWQLNLPVDALWFFLGGIVGIYLLDLAEEFFHLQPSPFRTVLFTIGLLIVGFYIITSTREMIAKGLVLSLSLTLLLFQWSEWRIKKSLTSWFTMMFETVPVQKQRWVLAIFFVVFGAEMILFLVS